MRYMFRSERARWCGVTSPSVRIERVTFEDIMGQAAVWPLVRAMRFPASLLGCGWAELRAYSPLDGLRGVLAPFRPERISQPRQTYPHRHRR